MQDFYTEVLKARNDQRKAALCILIETEGSTPRKAGSKMIVFQDKKTIGSIGGGSFEIKVISKAIEILNHNKPGRFRFDLDENIEMLCGGKAEVYIEPITPLLRLLIFGAGHVGKAVAELAVQFDFQVLLIDDRKEILDQVNIPGVISEHSDYLKKLKELISDERTFIVVVTPEHKRDEEVTAFYATQKFAYLGMIGSKKKVAMAKKNFLEKYKIPYEQVERINMPIGIPFNAQTPGEIAVSIIAKIIDVKNNL